MLKFERDKTSTCRLNLFLKLPKTTHFYMSVSDELEIRQGRAEPFKSSVVCVLIDHFPPMRPVRDSIGRSEKIRALVSRLQHGS